MVTPLAKSAAAVLFAAPVVLLSACAAAGRGAGHLTGYHAVDLDRVAGAVRGARRRGAAAGEGAHAAPRARRNSARPDEGRRRHPGGHRDVRIRPGYATVTVETTGTGKLSPGFHGLHIHSVGKCEANSVAPTGGSPGDFLSAGGHFQVPGHSGHPASGDLSSLQVRQDGSGLLVTTTDAFTEDDLLAGQKTAIIIHENADNFANIPPERYNQVNGTPGPDETTMATGDAGKRVACGVITGG